MSGGWKVEKMSVFEIVTEPIIPQAYADYVLRPEAGAVTIFTGHVREWTQGVRTLYLAYEAYVPMAQKTRRDWSRNRTEMGRNASGDRAPHWRASNR